MTRLPAVFALALFILALAGRTAPAWDNTGHEVIAVLAYRALHDEPTTQANILKLLKTHPHYDEYLAKPPPAGLTLDEAIVARAATWPDWVRPGSPHVDYHRSTWHYVNFPFVLAPADDTATRDKIEGLFSSSKENHGDILVAFPDSRRVVRDPDADMKRRAIRLCWVLHLGGDIHQPLHAATLCTKDLPGGDRGGNSVWVRRRGGGDPLPLHSLWDQLLSRASTDADLIARDLRKNLSVTSQQRRNLDIGTWAEESLDLAKTHAYRFNGTMIDFVIALKKEEAAQAPEVPEGYEAAAIAVGKQRVRVAGARLAEVLQADLGPVQ